MWVVLAVFNLFTVLNVHFVNAEDQPIVDPAKAAQMAEWQKFSVPTENHKRLDALVGKWNHTVKWQMNPGDEVQTMQGTNENKWILGGRFIQQDAKGPATESFPAFEGVGITGYDNVKGEYNSVWIDNMGTGMMIATGQFDSASNAINESGTFSCPMTGEKSKTFHAVWKIVDNDHYTYEMYTNDKDGKEFRNMEVAYERLK